MIGWALLINLISAVDTKIILDFYFGKSAFIVSENWVKKGLSTNRKMAQKVRILDKDN